MVAKGRPQSDITGYTSTWSAGVKTAIGSPPPPHRIFIHQFENSVPGMINIEMTALDRLNLYFEYQSNYSNESFVSGTVSGITVVGAIYLTHFTRVFAIYE